MTQFFKKISSFDAENLGSVDLRAAKLLAIKVGDLKKSLPPDPGPSRTSRVCADSKHSQSLMAGNFAALKSTDPKFSALKYLYLLQTVSKFQEVNSFKGKFCPVKVTSFQ